MSDFQSGLVEKAERFTKPISADAPSGSDISYDVEFEAIKAEIDKLTSVSGGQPQWRDVVEKAERILENRSRDLRLLVWSGVARLQTGGVTGFAFGLAVLERVISTQWETMFPPAKRAKARANLIDWMNDQVAAVLQPLEPTEATGDAFRAIEQFYDTIDGSLAERLGDAYGGLGILRSLLRGKVRAIPAPAAAIAASPAAAPASPIEAAPRAAQPQPTASVAVASASPTQSSFSAPSVPQIGSAEGVLEALPSLGEGLVSAAQYLRAADPANPLAYRLHRLGIWLAVTEAPHAEEGRTRIRAPGDDLRKELDSRVTAEQWIPLLNRAEELSFEYIFWLDVHRYAVLAMDRLGALFVDAKKAAGNELVQFLKRAPAIRALAFADGTPFADPATQMWLDEAFAKFGGEGSGGAKAGAVTDEDAEIEKRFVEAQEMVSGGKIAEGIGLAAQLAPRAADERRRFRGRLKVAELSLLGNKPEVGRPILEALLRQIDERRLEEWEPDLCASVARCLVATYRALGASVDAAQSQALVSRLCLLDPAAALKWSAVAGG